MRGWEDLTAEDVAKLSYKNRIKNNSKPAKTILNKVNTNRPKNKYNAVKTTTGGIKFDSKAEANYYNELLLLKKVGIVKSIILQKDFTLQEAYTKENGERIRAIRYRADFEVKYADGHTEIVDVKGKRTKEYLIKKKMLLTKYPDINFKEIRK